MLTKKTTLFLPLFVSLFFSALAGADVRLPHIFSSNMVLQQQHELPVWGWADPGEHVKVVIAGRIAETEADPNGQWLVTLQALSAGGPFKMTITGKNTLELTNCLVGEVWLCSGQSNMEWPVAASNNAAKEIAESNYPSIRLFQAPHKTSGRPLDDIDASWQICNPQSVSDFSAVAYFFGRQIHKELVVPVGLINCSWGGSRIEPWTPPVGFASVDMTKFIYQQIKTANADYRKNIENALVPLQTWLTKTKEAISQGIDIPPDPLFPKHPLDNYWQPTAMYNAMIHPLVPFAIRGALWYQGEANITDIIYIEKMKALIKGWRKVWAQGDFPFYYVQLAPYRYTADPYYRTAGNPEYLPLTWEAQLKALSIPNTGMAVTVDLVDDITDIHPRNKQDVGKRLALWALAKTYGKNEIMFSGPLYKSFDIEGDKIRIFFDYTGSSLAASDGKPLTSFEIAGTDKKFLNANAQIDKDTLLVSCPDVNQPVAVRFAWHQEAKPNLCNKELLPASPFRTDQW